MSVLQAFNLPSKSCPWEQALNSTFWHPFLRLVHLYAGIFIAPFIFIAALTGFFYAATPQVENWLYQDVLYVEANQPFQQSLSQQVEHVKNTLPRTAQITEVRPSAGSNQTTRVIFSDATLGINNQAVFIDPYTLDIKGQFSVYGTSGVLPLRAQLDHLHRDLGLGHWGRLYSELAASWLIVLILTGLYYWSKRRKTVHKKRTRDQAYLRLHSKLGFILFPLLLFVAVTGLTWSGYAGDNIRWLRQTFDWQTPVLNTAIHAESVSSMNMHHHEGHVMDATRPRVEPHAQDFETALILARKYGIQAAQLQIKPPSSLNEAWSVTELQRQWPTQADSIAIDVANNRVIDRLYFKDYSLVAKLTRWGVDAHIGILFGWINQLILLLYAFALCLMIGYAYWATYRRTRFKSLNTQLYTVLVHTWKHASVLQRLSLLSLCVGMSILLPVWGLSLVVMFIMLLIEKIKHRNTIH